MIRGRYDKPAPFTRRDGTIGAKSVAASFDTCCAWYVLIAANFKSPALSTSYFSPILLLEKAEEDEEGCS